MLAAAKINLDLRVTGRREDGYHLLDSIVVFADVGDELTAEHSDDLSLDVCGPFARGLSTNNNIILNAAHRICERANVKPALNFKLTKNLPVSSGIGGGSADAAAALKLCNELLGINFTHEQLNEIGLEIGADVPVCLHSNSCHMRGIGENIKPISVKGPIHLLLVNPGISVSTPEIFNKFHEDNEPFEQKREIGDDEIHLPLMIDLLKDSKNSLQVPACKLNGAISNVLQELENTGNVLISRMSGSGATCFAIYEESEQCVRAASNLRKKFSNWWVRETCLL